MILLSTFEYLILLFSKLQPLIKISEEFDIHSHGISSFILSLKTLKTYFLLMFFIETKCGKLNLVDLNVHFNAPSGCTHCHFMILTHVLRLRMGCLLLLQLDRLFMWYCLHGTDIIAKKCVKFLLHGLAELTNRLHCNFQREALINWLPVMMKTYCQKEFNIKA